MKNQNSITETYPTIAPIAWLAGFGIASGWIAGNWNGWPIYPGQWVFSAILLVILWRDLSAPRHVTIPIKILWPGIFLGVFISFLSFYRENYEAGGASILATVTLVIWGRAAYLIGRGSRGAGRLPESLLMVLAAGLVMGLLGWAFRAWWTVGCLAISCPEEPIFPYSFLGGWSDHELWWLQWLLITPVALPELLLLYRNPYGITGHMIPALILGLATISLLPGATGWMLVLLLIWAGGMVVGLAPLARPEDVRPLRHAGFVIAGGGLVIFGLFPGYLSLTDESGIKGAEIRIEVLGGAPNELSSEKITELEIHLTNTGLVSLFTQPDEVGSLKATLLVTPEAGDTRIFQIAPIEVPTPLSPGRSTTLHFQLRPPHWAAGGYLAWGLEQEGRDITLDPDGPPGFRFTNRAFRDLSMGSEDDLTALAGRARNIAEGTSTPMREPRQRYSIGNVVGALFDTLFFSPLWGLQATEPARFPFAPPWPFWPRLWHDYGLIGMGLGLWFFLRLIRMAQAIGTHEVQVAGKMTWRLLVPVLVVIGMTGIFSSVLGSYFGLWALFLTGGFVEGRYDNWYAPRTMQRRNLQGRLSSTSRKWGLFRRRPPTYFPSAKRKTKRRW